MELKDKNILEEVEKFTGNLLKNKDDIRKLIKAAVSNNKEEEFEKLTFTAKYISGMFRVVKSAPGIPEVASIDHLKNDLNENLKKGIDQLKDIISASTENIADHFDKKYFTLTQENFVNLTQLFSDLEAVKKYLNYLKRQ